MYGNPIIRIFARKGGSRLILGLLKTGFDEWAKLFSNIKEANYEMRPTPEDTKKLNKHGKLECMFHE